MAAESLSSVACLLAACGLLVAPGYCLARLLTVPGAVFAALPLSAFVLFCGVVGMQGAGTRITFWPVAAWLAAVTAVCGWRLMLPGSQPEASKMFSAGRPPWLVVAFGGAVITAVALRLALFPLSGFDTLWRWEYLARLLLDHGRLDFFPPRSAADFRVYHYPDGFPPLIPTLYWFLYAAVGKPVPVLTSIVVCAQLVSCCGLAAMAARELWGGHAAAWTVALLLGSPLFVSAVAMGQDTGFTAIAIAGQLACGLAARRHPTPWLGFAAGLFAALGASAREYGPALAGCGLVVLAADVRTRRLVPAFLAGAAVAAPWYVRAWWLTGNPLWSNPTPLGLPANPVHAGIFEMYRETRDLWRLDWPELAALGRDLAAGALPVVAAGIGGLAASPRRGWPLVVAAAGVAGLWVWSMGVTAGGTHYSLRVLAPCWVTLAVMGADIPSQWLAAVTRSGLAVRSIGVMAMAAWGAWAIASAAALPFPVTAILHAVSFASGDPIDNFPECADIIRAMNASSVPGCRILTDDTYLAAMLARTGSRFEPVMVWSPKVAYLFDDGIPSAEIDRRLAADGISLTSLHPRVQTWPYLARHRWFREGTLRWQTRLETSQIAIRQINAVHTPPGRGDIMNGP